MNSSESSEDGNFAVHDILVHGGCFVALRGEARDKSLHLLAPSDVCQHHHRDVREDGVVQSRRRRAAGQIHARFPDLAENYAFAIVGLRGATFR